ncbi:hypothetical protein TVAG_446970 [Trichomonas vaginalis G3]|uniref:Uncharacterized protein n=1 Tax=Trichomonas vaginalis (strain ATCC PRA-98 / G3) TaxID=412133 RepID=A2E8Q5_TRIV3|nr:armadillo (ARM) repeat-containing protein family [Trichomonas vaginalis G3]EAY10994.1 hypothetical protein TVAG_446970 [Trichomonas vaginalis G3]KAI5530805.1 armadillo (ARM) repeat-containing protein family [Trichomonas vaginalis G3]|eukprot:XP_001323217.1 hypothetical protein [Trichomonas vaginalis G3]
MSSIISLKLNNGEITKQETYTVTSVLDILEKTDMNSQESIDNTINVVKSYSLFNNVYKTNICNSILETIYSKISSPALTNIQFGLILLESFTVTDAVTLNDEIVDDLIQHTAPLIQKNDLMILTCVFSIYNKIASNDNYTRAIVQIIDIPSLISTIMNNSDIQYITVAINLLSTYCKFLGREFNQEELIPVFDCASHLLSVIIPDPNLSEPVFDENYKPILESILFLLVKAGTNAVWDTLWNKYNLLPYMNNCFLYIHHTTIKMLGLKLFNRLLENSILIGTLNYEKVVSLIKHKSFAIQTEALKCIGLIDERKFVKLLNETDLLQQFHDILIDGRVKAKLIVIDIIERRKDAFNFLYFYEDTMIETLLSNLAESSSKTQRQICLILTMIQRKMNDEGRADEMRSTLVSLGAEDILNEISLDNNLVADSATELLNFIICE